MNKPYLAILLAAGLVISGCKSNEPKPEEKAPASVATKAEPAPAAAPVAAKPECPPEQATTKKKATTTKATTKATSKTKTTTKKEEPAAPADCEPAKPAKEAPAKEAPAKEASAKPATEAKPAPAPSSKETTAVGKACNPCVVKSKDGTFDGEVYGNIPPNSKWAQLRIGMEQPEVERLLGVSHQVHAYPTAKAWVPFYFGTDRTRYEVTYPGQGSVSYTGGSWGGGRGILMMINYDPK